MRIIIRRDAARNEIEVNGTIVSLNEAGRNREMRMWLQDTLFPNEKTPKGLRAFEDRSRQTGKRKRRRRSKGQRKDR